MLLLTAALAAAGCGVGPGRGLGEVELTVTRDYGARRVAAPVRDAVTESDTVMRLLDRKARISTRYGGGFVQSIDGIAGGERGGRRYDWFFYVDGVESGVGAADYALHGGEAVWWDHREWSAAMAVPAVVGSWPQPFASGYEGRRRPVAVECLGGGATCAEVERKLIQAGVRGRLFNRHADEKTTAAEGAAEGTAGGAATPVITQAAAPSDALRVLVGPWARLRGDPAAAQIEAGPQASGVFAEFRRGDRGFSLWGLDEAGAAARRFGAGAGLVAATRRGEAPPVWVVTGAGAAGVRAAAGLLDSHDLRDHYAVVSAAGKTEPLPLRSSKRGPGPAK
jgi:Domain of unknown function (DUF4430)